MDYTPSSRRLSEISHLFLSDVRKAQTGDEARPARTPPGGFRGDVSVDMTPEEFAQVIRPAAGVETVRSASPSFKPIRAVIAHHLGETMAERVRDFAVAVGGAEPVGVIYAGDAGLRVCCVDPAETACEGAEDAPPEPLDVQRLREVLVELDQDVCQWLVVLPDPRSADAQTLMKDVKDWTLLSGADHDGVVAAYRALKGLCGDASPRLSVSVFGAPDAEAVDKTHRKLAGVCEQFLKVGLTVGPAVSEAVGARELCLFDAGADDASAPHWSVLAGLADGAGHAPTAPIPVTPMPTPNPVHRSIPAPAATVSLRMADEADDVIDLSDADASPAGIVRALVRHGDWVESTVKAPALPDAVVAVDAGRRLTLLAVARPGLADLRAVAAAFRWMNENRTLISMAAPQLGARADADVKLHLLVDAADADAAAVHPLLAGGSVTLAPFRKLRWAGRTGLLLNAA